MIENIVNAILFFVMALFYISIASVILSTIYKLVYRIITGKFPEEAIDVDNTFGEKR